MRERGACVNKNTCVMVLYLDHGVAEGGILHGTVDDDADDLTVHTRAAVYQYR